MKWINVKLDDGKQVRWMKGRGRSGRGGRGGR
jgi:hypothetical protein